MDKKIIDPNMLVKVSNPILQKHKKTTGTSRHTCSTPESHSGRRLSYMQAPLDLQILNSEL